MKARDVVAFSCGNKPVDPRDWVAGQTVHSVRNGTDCSDVNWIVLAGPMNSKTSPYSVSWALMRDSGNEITYPRFSDWVRGPSSGWAWHVHEGEDAS